MRPARHDDFRLPDLIFVPTLSELHLAGLVTYLEQESATLPVNWHLQFHFNIFDISLTYRAPG